MNALPAQIAVHQHHGLVVGLGEGQRQVDRGERLALGLAGARDHDRPPRPAAGQVLDLGPQHLVVFKFRRIRRDADAVMVDQGCGIQFDPVGLGVDRGFPVGSRDFFGGPDGMHLRPPGVLASKLFCFFECFFQVHDPIPL